ncbi:ribosomal protein S18-alanine N-acetyltransferase [Pseudodesulfovibrio sp. zrk46]|uniref:ribosomal protein S18-alanine N-acetyltransferase n=1 Tax=Pseudodesulfovibrio sp. zrk46 TaxID=2725288 RepID=UPI00144A1037|nr:ribosomal protein S18-alanine N-acetyltransferase [Pseudodesulfovibrio sp. zrk46]QJB57732.1 ribosomal protein S18-alanine N-acetyltransferase [Pseudodesulfovibrio sp. zrk46]
MSGQVIQLKASDLDDLIKLEKSCFDYHWSRDQFLMGLERGVFKILGVREDARLVGYIAISLIEDEMEILNLAVHTDYRKRGLAKALLKRAFEICTKKGIVKSFLDVKISNTPAIDLYKKFGYVQVGVRKRYYPDTKEDALLFRCDFATG